MRSHRLRRRLHPSREGRLPRRDDVSQTLQVRVSQSGQEAWYRAIRVGADPAHSFVNYYGSSFISSYQMRDPSTLSLHVVVSVVVVIVVHKHIPVDKIIVVSSSFVWHSLSAR